MIITIDGPAGAGKSTVAKLLAQKLKIAYLDTGALYRAVTLKGMRAELDQDNEDLWVEMAQTTEIIPKDLNGELQLFLDGEDISREIRSDEVTEQVRYIAQMPKIRALMVQLQQNLGAHLDVVGEGRDLGTVVFPNADYKFYLDADPLERAKRRALEMKEKGDAVDLRDLQDNMQERDQMDQSREVSPLKPAEDSIIIDSTALNADQVVEQIVNVVQNG